jgi:HEAT repeat protein
MDFSAAIEGLSHRDPSRRIQALEALVEVGLPAGPTLVRTLRYSNKPLARAAAAQALGRIEARDAVHSLCAALSDDKPAVRREAARALARLGDRIAVPALCGLAASGDAAAIDALRTMPDERALPVLIRHARTMPVAVAALGRIEHPDVVPALCRVLRSLSPGVTEAAFAELRRINDPRSATAVFEIAVDATQFRDSVTVMIAAFGAQVVPDLVHRLSHPEQGPLAEEILRMIGLPAVRVLKALLRGVSSEARLRACQVLAGIGTAEVVEPLCGALQDSADEVRVEAAMALGPLGDRRAVEPLRALMATRKPAVRARAVLALGALGDTDPAWVPDILYSLESGKPYTFMAAELLAQMARTAPTPALCGALPILERMLGVRWRNTRAELEMLRSTARAIEAATGALAGLPIPSASGSLSAAQLPRPAGAPNVDPEGLPIPLPGEWGNR